MFSEDHYSYCFENRLQLDNSRSQENGRTTIILILVHVRGNVPGRLGTVPEVMKMITIPFDYIPILFRGGLDVRTRKIKESEMIL